MWFAILITTETAWLEGPDTADLRQVESSYPLAPGRVLRPPVSIEQWDFLITFRIIAPLRKKVLYDLQKLMLTGKTQSFTTVYVCTFILLHLCSMWSADRARHARKHDSPVSLRNPTCHLTLTTSDKIHTAQVHRGSPSRRKHLARSLSLLYRRHRLT